MQFSCTFAPPLTEDKVQRVIPEFSKVGLDATELSRGGLEVTFTAPGTETDVSGPLLSSWIAKGGFVTGYFLVGIPPPSPFISDEMYNNTPDNHS